MASQANEISDSARWLLVSRRDLSANSSFFYGVKSTQIFCRPTCPGRVARRGNVIFFNDLQHASQSGYRPCKRCEPCNDSWSRDNSGRRIAYRAHAMIVAAEADNVKWTVESMARKLGLFCISWRSRRKLSGAYEARWSSFILPQTQDHETSCYT
ncbi:Bifunctional transcriptional activator/DNA repair enzyme AdaA [Colletotrichum fructicola Nara gc5]|uniref:Bifunctional transcriptional activator/DNA repair enzyme AdaA n=1 Tax=Colletotrichum fructicola (strain Nara gc5) TaxID=1213859 RepID=A0A7J6JAU0_COLFN|nr:Bifunctional transcriptional activator/DNA repair enzyme AdaA [Colletotrichum fructicola Nara gc5]